MSHSFALDDWLLRYNEHDTYTISASMHTSRASTIN